MGSLIKTDIVVEDAVLEVRKHLAETILRISLHEELEHDMAAGSASRKAYSELNMRLQIEDFAFQWQNVKAIMERYVPDLQAPSPSPDPPSPPPPPEPPERG